MSNYEFKTTAEDCAFALRMTADCSVDGTVRVNASTLLDAAQHIEELSAKLDILRASVETAFECIKLRAGELS